MLGVAVLAIAFVALPPERASDYALTRAQQAQARATYTSESFASASEAAFAASLRYGGRVLVQEVGAKIYADIVQRATVFSYGPPIYGQSDNDTGEDIVEYDPLQSDGHFALVGIWHEHPYDEGFLSLYGHYAEIAQTHQAIWTTIGRSLYAQFWDGTQPMPAWTSAIPAIQPILTV